MIMPGPEGDAVRGTGGQVDEITMALIDAAHDRNEEAREIISNSLYDLGKKKPSLVLSSCYTYLKKHNKLSTDHRIVILNALERILKEVLDNIDVNLAVDLIHQAADELTQSKEVEPEWQTAASGVLVALGTKYCDEVMGELLDRFQPGVIPHFFVVQTIGNLASANVYAMVPHLTAVLGTMLPMLGMIKFDNMRWVFTSALSRFSEAILEYIANLDKAPDSSITKEKFSGEIFSAYDIIFNIWLQSKEAKLRLAIVEAVGHMTHVMDQDKLEEQFPKILQGMLGLYRRHPEPYHITQGLCMVLDAVCKEESPILEPHFDNLFNILFAQVLQVPDYTNPLSIKNHNELLRSFTIIARSFSGRLVGLLLQKLETTNEKTRIGVLTIFKHIINSAGPSMEDKKEVVVSGLKNLCQDTNNKVKKVFAQVVIAMAHHGYLELEGGQLMVEFIVRQCALPDDPPGKRPADPEWVSNKALRSMCENILQLVTTTIERMEIVLWPYLLELIVPEQYTEAAGALCRSLAYLSTKKREENADDYEIDYETQANIPKPPSLAAKLVVLAGRPLNGRERGVHVLQMMKGISTNIHENLVELWDTVIPKLVQYLEDHLEDEGKWSQKNWEDLLLKMLAKSLDVIDSEEWIADFGELMGQHVIMYHNASEEKNFLYKCLGIIMRKSTKKDFVTKHLDLLFSTVKHTDQTEKEGCAIAVGFSAASHLDAVLTKLETVAKNDTAKKSTGILSVFKGSDKSEGVPEKVKSTIMLCYGFVALYSPPTLIVSRMEATILRTIAPYFQNVKSSIIISVDLRRNLIHCISLLGQCYTQDCMQSVGMCALRGDMLSSLQNYMKAEPVGHLSNETRALAMNACATLIKLDPRLSEAEIFDLIKTGLDCTLGLSLTGFPLKKGKEETYDEMLEMEVLMDATFQALYDMLTCMLTKNLTPEGLETIFKHLVPWILDPEEHKRERALKTWQNVLTFYLEQADITSAERFSNEGIFLARMIPRCTDPSINIRLHAIDCVQLTLKIGLRYEGNDADHKDQMVEALATLKERLKKGDPNILFSVINDLSKVVSKKLPADHLQPFMEVLQEGLLDAQSHSSSGACVVLNGLMKTRGSELHKEVSKILDNLYEKLRFIQCPQTRTGTLRTIRTMASHHLIPVVTTLLGYPLPYDEHIVEVWHIIAQESQLTASMIDHFLDLLQKSLPYEEKPDPRDKTQLIKTATIIPPCCKYYQVTYALKEIFEVEESEEQVLKSFHRLFAALMVRVGSAVGVGPPKTQVEKEEPKPKDKKKAAKVEHKLINPSHAVTEAFQKFLQRAKSFDMCESLEKEMVFINMEDEMLYPESITTLARVLVASTAEAAYTSKIVANLTSVLSSLFDPQRVVVAAFFAELINQKCAGDDTLVELIMNSLLGRLVDSSHVVRMLCIRGLSNVASVGKDQVQKYSTTILSAMMAGMDDKEDPNDDITIEAMSGLSRIMSEIDESHIRAILINVALKIRPCFEKEKPAVRAQAFILFGNLSRFGDGPSRAPFLEQIHSNFISLLLHLNDPEPDVKKACKYALRMLGPLIGSEAVNDKFQKHLLEEANLFYGEFMNDLSKLIIQDFSEKTNFYVMGCVAFFKSHWDEIKSNAAMFAGFMLGNLPKEKQGNITKEHVCSALVLLLKDISPQVRCKAAEAMSLLYDY
ncbi:LOW QUALITY PROTEIN: maestro heat-like repeat-containing protein family member 1 [Haliotis rubra]|uniref:LOW QUALITY PROTEIN: maestro heat-like repeat-containing protein family member 1 n=1 Tax=Haliotis rubra TaxID=36100 RepID=UPI001EE5EC04|nr:LOW QUALITY PROTEIN: maestro heat-like repeat-containing protein family member 1 [Haliotis rubra]